MYMFNIKSPFLPTLSAKRPIRILPNNPIRPPAPIKPVQKLVNGKYDPAWSKAIPLIPSAYPQAICPNKIEM